jgi:hypothetical protein
VKRVLLGAILVLMVAASGSALAARSDCMVNGEFTPKWNAFYNQCMADEKCNGRADAVCGALPSSSSQRNAWAACRDDAAEFENQCWRNCTSRTMTKFDCFKP